MNSQSQPAQGLLGASGNIPEAQFAQSTAELKKLDLFDLGLVLTICAADGLDMLNEEYLERLCDWKRQCCIAHAVAKISASAPEFD